jgi:hypothetical protein
MAANRFSGFFRQKPILMARVTALDEINDAVFWARSLFRRPLSLSFGRTANKGRILTCAAGGGQCRASL